MNTIEPYELIDMYLDECISEPEGLELNHWLNESDENMRRFAEYCCLHLRLRQLMTADDHTNSFRKILEASGSFSGINVNEELDGPIPLKELPDLPPAPKCDRDSAGTPLEDRADNDDELVAKFGRLRVYRRIKEVDAKPWASRLKPFAAAAAVGLILLAGWWAMQPTPVATLTQANNLTWSDTDSPPLPGDRLTTGRYGLESGFAELRFDDGTTVVLEAPIDFNLTGISSMKLADGRLAATIADTTDRFLVSTPSTNVIDLGTEFGVEVSDDGATDVAVFDGEVQLADSVDSNNSNRTTLNLIANQQAHASIQGVLPKQAEPLDPSHPFTRSFEELSHQLRVKGDVRWFRISPEAANHQLVEPDHMIVFREAADIRGAEGRYAAPILETGRHKRVEIMAVPYVVPGNQSVDSYMIHCNRGTRDRMASKRILSGEITFPRPIVAVLVRSKDLYASDSHYGLPHVTYPAPGSDAYRGTELTDAEGIDVIHISEDRRTLRLEFLATVMDQTRVLIESE